MTHKLSGLLRPLSWLYRGGLLLRNRGYDLNLLPSVAVGVPVISVGNLRMGGSGKTPLVEHLARRFLRDGYRVGIVSRGYKRQSTGQVVVSRGRGPEIPVAQAGDEPYMLSLLLPETIVVVDADRVAAARTAVREFDADLILMDDGFQHRRLRRTSNIVVIPAGDIATRARVVPAGPLREPWAALRRATHLLVVGQPDPAGNQTAERFLGQWSDAPVFWGEKASLPVLENPAADHQINLKESERPPTVLALAGIGAPHSFRTALEALPLHVQSFREYPDHYRYPRDVQEQLLREMEGSGAEYLVMTAKDYVKWDADLCARENIFFVRPRYTITPPLFRALPHR